MEQVRLFLEHQKRIFMKIINNLFLNENEYLRKYKLLRRNDSFYEIILADEIYCKKKEKNSDDYNWEIALKNIREFIVVEGTERYNWIDSFISGYEYFIFFEKIRSFIMKNNMLRNNRTYYDILHDIVDETYKRVALRDGKRIFIEDYIESTYVLKGNYEYTYDLMKDIGKLVLRYKEKKEKVL